MKNDAEQLRKWSIATEIIALLSWLIGLTLVHGRGSFIWPYWVHFINAFFFILLAIGLKVNALYYRKQ